MPVCTRNLRYPRLALFALALSQCGMATASVAMPPEAASCSACHGAAGEGLAAANYPRLAGLPAGYIADQLRLFADGQRANAIMAGMAKPLSAAQISTLADYYAGLPVKGSAPATTVAPELAARGEQLAVSGDWKSGIPACFRCHGPGGVGVPPVFPPLVGQSAAYLVGQISAWKTGGRQGDPQGLMHTVAQRMSDADTQAVAAWLATQKPTTAKITPQKP